MSSHVHAPELEPHLGWLNTDRPLRMRAELRGQVVVLDFWTFCCINCIHILPDLKYLEEKYADEPVTFIGVHSAKFPNESTSETIRSAILRYEIRHPVVIDDRMKIWRQYAVRSWPTVVVVDASGYVAAVAAGEGNREVLDCAIATAMQSGRSAGTLARGPLEVRREGMVRAASGLAFPGKVLADATTGRLYVADSNHNRIVVAELPDDAGRSRLVQVIGRGAIGREDGPAHRATFDHPQGLAVARDRLYVADTENHLIRAIDLRSFEVSTVCGTGEMCNDRAGGGMGTEQGLNSPWDLTIEGSTLYAAMAGTHQIWRIDLPVGFARALAGSGRENLVDGPTETAALAQPSGICILGGRIYFADSEVSAIRGIDMAAEQVFTVIGEGLFTYGDVDGAYPDARFQHPLGVAAWRTSLIVADTYNHKIKLVEPGARSAVTLYGTGKPGTRTPDDRPAFFEPGGLSVAGDRLFVADTNNHRIVEINLVTHAWREVAIDGLTAPGDGEAPDSDARTLRARIPANSDIELVIEPELPVSAELSAEAPWSIRIEANGRTLLQQTGRGADLRCIVPSAVFQTQSPWTLHAAFAYCSKSDGLCVPVAAHWRVDWADDGSDALIRLPISVD